MKYSKSKNVLTSIVKSKYIWASAFFSIVILTISIVSIFYVNNFFDDLYLLIFSIIFSLFMLIFSTLLTINLGRKADEANDKAIEIADSNNKLINFYNIEKPKIEKQEAYIEIFNALDSLIKSITDTYLYIKIDQNLHKDIKNERNKEKFETSISNIAFTLDVIFYCWNLLEIKIEKNTTFNNLLLEIFSYSTKKNVFTKPDYFYIKKIISINREKFIYDSKHKVKITRNLYDESFEKNWLYSLTFFSVLTLVFLIKEKNLNYKNLNKNLQIETLFRDTFSMFFKNIDINEKIEDIINTLVNNATIKEYSNEEDFEKLVLNYFESINIASLSVIENIK